MNQDYQKVLDEMLLKIEKKKKKPRLLLHACCAPCSSYVLEYLSKYFDITIYYYNPNIEPMKEFDKRVVELERLIKEMPLDGKVDIVVETYDNKEFKTAIRGYENLSEGSERCFICYNLRMDKSATYAKKNKYDYFTTTLSISPYKNCSKINEIGASLEEKYKVKYLYADFKKKNGYKRSIELSKIYNLYRQDYCGCIYSKIEAEKRRKEKEIRSGVEVLMREQDIKRKKKTTNDFKVKKSDYNYHFSIVKVLFVLILLALGVYAFRNSKTIINFINNKDNKTNENPVVLKKEEISDKITKLNELYFYGNHFNLKGTITIDNSTISTVNLVLVGKKHQYSYPLIFLNNANGISYYASNELNKGIDFKNVDIDEYTLYIEVNDNGNKEYYNILNDTNYKETTYYTVSNNNSNNKISITNDTKSTYMNVSKATEEIYDIVIDPGHGGKDEGACYNKVCETDYTLVLANLVKTNLETMGYKVALTRDQDVYLEKYGNDGRITRAYNTKAKLLISIHLNSNTVKGFSGFELYTSTNLDLTLARNIISGIKNVNGLNISNNTSFRKEAGIYSRTFTTSNIKDINDEIETPYKNISTKTNYYFMIRETGGYMAGAYVDGQDGDGENINRNSNVGLESYILELGFINNPDNVEDVKNNKEKYMQALANAINTYFKG